MMLKFEDIRKGDVVYENHAGQSIEVMVMTEPKRDIDGAWTFDACTTVGHVHYLQHEKYRFYGPNLTREPQCPPIHWGNGDAL